MVVSLRVWSGNGNTDMTINRDPSKGVSLCVRSGNGNIVRDYLAVEARVLLRMWNRNGNNAAVECDDIFCRFRFACRAGMETNDRLALLTRQVLLYIRSGNGNVRRVEMSRAWSRNRNTEAAGTRQVACVLLRTWSRNGKNIEINVPYVIYGTGKEVELR